MKTRIITFAMAMLCMSLMAQVFQLENTANLHLTLNGKNIIDHEYCSLFASNPFEKSKKRHEKNKEMEIFNTYGQIGDFPFRREIAIKKAGEEIEINFQAFCPAYSQNPPSDGLVYGINIPFSTIEGCSFTAINGRSYSTKEITGKFLPGEYDNLLKAKIRYLFVTLKSGENISIDCDPKGVNCDADYAPDCSVGLWNVSRIGDSLRISVGFGTPFYGGNVSGKLLISKATMEDYDTHHSRRSFDYFTEFTPERNYAFGAYEHGKQYQQAGIDTYSEETGYGWRNPTGLRGKNYAPQGALYSAVWGNAPATFTMSGLRKGFHIVTVAASAADTPAGPFDIKCNGKVYGEKIVIPKNTVKLLSFGLWIEDGIADISFIGKNWCVSTIGNILLQSSDEDYTFRRGFWASKKGPYPTVLLSSKSYAKEPKYSTRLDSYPLPVQGQEAKGTPKTLEYPQCHAEFDNPDDDWRYGAMIASFGPANYGNFDEFEKGDKLQKRIDDLKKNNVNTVLVNGMLSRHTYESHLPRVNKMLGRITKEAHKNNMIVVDHIDYSLLWNKDGGFRVMVENLPFLLTNIKTNMPTSGFCVGNKHATKAFIDNLEKVVKTTGIDGIMIDEACYHGESYCGCGECRRAFYEETGWQLPVNELSPDLFNRDSQLWSVWLKWRQKHVGDFWYDMKSRMKKINKQFVAMGYTTHYGLTSNYATIQHGAAIEQSARGWDFIGTEIMSRNSYACYRPIQAYRKMKNFLKNTSNVPTFGLVYSATNCWDIEYFGWAMNMLNGQSTWGDCYEPPAGKAKYHSFVPATGNFDLKNAKSKAKIVFVFSSLSNDFPRRIGYTNQLLGNSTALNTQHIEHEFISSMGLTDEILSQFSMLVLDNTENISDEDIKKALDFASKGGTLVLTHRVAQADGAAVLQDGKWPFTPILKGLAPNLATSEMITAIEMDGVTTVPERPIPSVRITDVPKELKTYGTATCKNGTTQPFIIEMPYGNGRIIYTPLAIGHHCRMTEVTVGQTVPDDWELAPKCLEACTRFWNAIITDENPWNPGNTPEAVLTGLFEVNGTQTVIAFLNATGSNTKNGMVIPGVLDANPFPHPEEDLVFSIKRNDVTTAYATSPDFEGKRPLKFTKLQNGETQITLPKELLNVFTVVFAE